MTGRAPAGGFTLLEVLVATTLVSLLVVMLFAGFGTGMRTWDAGEAAAARTGEMRLVSGFIRRQLEQAVPLMVREDRRWRLRFSGRDDRIRFVSEMSSRLGPGGLWEITIVAAGQGDGRTVRLLRRLAHPDVDDDATITERDEVVLVENASRFELSYFGTVPGASGPGWTSRWNDAQRMPELIRVETGVAGERDWPPIVVKTRVHRPVYERAPPGSGSSAAEPPDEEEETE